MISQSNHSEREREKWLMWEFIRLGYSAKDLLRLNRVRLHMQVIFLSDILGASGGDLDENERYLSKRSEGVNWSTLQFPKEKPTPGDFRLWKMALRQVVPAGGMRVHLGRFLHKGYKIWEWRYDAEEQLLVRYKGISMDVYEPNSTTRRRWVKTHSDVDAKGDGNALLSSRESS